MALWAVLGGMAAVATLIIALIPVIPSEKSSSLMLRGFEVAKPSEIDANYSDVSKSGASSAVRKEEATLVDITLENTGSKDALIVGVDILMRYAAQLKNCPASGGDVEVSADYDIKVPESPLPTPFNLHREVRFEVEAGKRDRFRLSVGPDKVSASSWVPWLYAFDISLRYDDTRLKVGTAGLVAPSGNGANNLKYSVGSPDFACLEENNQILEGISRIGGKQSAELSEVITGYSGLISSYTAGVTETCSTPTRKSPLQGIVQVCGAYSRRLLQVRIRLQTPPVLESTKLVLDFSVPGTETRLRQVGTYTSNPYGNLWSLESLRPPDRDTWSETDPSSSSTDRSNGAEVKVFTLLSNSQNYKSLALIVRLLAVGGGPDVLDESPSTPGGLLLVRHG